MVDVGFIGRKERRFIREHLDAAEDPRQARGKLSGPGQRDGAELLFRNNQVDDAPPLEGLRRVAAAEHRYLLGARNAGALHQALSSAEQRVRTDCDPDLAQKCGVRGQDHVTRQSDLQAAAQHVAVQSGSTLSKRAANLMGSVCVTVVAPKVSITAPAQTSTAAYAATESTAPVPTPDQENALAAHPRSTFKDCRELSGNGGPSARRLHDGLAGGQADRLQQEGPQHKVVVSRAFPISPFEVTFRQWDACAAHRRVCALAG